MACDRDYAVGEPVREERRQLTGGDAYIAAICKDGEDAVPCEGEEAYEAAVYN